MNMEKMLKTASGKLGIPADELKNLLNKGDMNAIMSKMKSDEAKKFKDALANPNISEVLKKSPEMKEYMKDMEEK